MLLGAGDFIYSYGALAILAAIASGAVIGACVMRMMTPRRIDGAQAADLIKGLFEWTNEMAQDMSEFRTVMNRLSERCVPHDAEASELVEEDPHQVLEKITAANRKLQQRLETAERALQQQSLEIASYVNEARTDPLTRLDNRRAFDEHLNRRFAEWRRHATPLSVVLVDIDSFKVFNDTHGHLAGDAVLIDVANVMRGTMRESDIVARFGGEEFAVILPATDWEDASRAAERVRRAVEACRVGYEGKMLSVTASCGVAQACGTESVSNLLKRADNALYASKDAGRNFSHLHDGQRCVPLTNSNRPATQATPPASSPALPPLSPSARRAALHRPGVHLDVHDTDEERSESIPSAPSSEPASDLGAAEAKDRKRSFNDVCRRLQERLRGGAARE